MKTLRLSYFDSLDQQRDYDLLKKQVIPLLAFMEKMPVLSQGNYGSCMTYSTTGALDVLYKNATDSISQKWSLNLGVWLSRQPEHFYTSNIKTNP